MGQVVGEFAIWAPLRAWGNLDIPNYIKSYSVNNHFGGRFVRDSPDAHCLTPMEGACSVDEACLQGTQPTCSSRAMIPPQEPPVSHLFSFGPI